MFTFRDPEMTGQVMTVRGLLPAARMGITLPHEHILIQHSANVLLDDAELAAEELALFRQFNGGTVVDMSNVGLGREPKKLLDISLKSNVNIIAGTGYYKASWHPPDMDRKTVDDIEREMTDDLCTGMDGTDIKAGVIGEIGISPTGITENEEKVLVASAGAHRKTGATISVHFDIGVPQAQRDYAIDLLEGEGVRLDKVILCHFGQSEDLPDVARMASRGCYVEYDLVLHQPTFTLEKIASRFKELIAMGHLGKILMSQDICIKGFLLKHGGKGYVHMLKTIVPSLLRMGMSEMEMWTIVCNNPQRVFSRVIDVGTEI